MVILFLKETLTKREVLVVMTCDILVMYFSSIVIQFYCCKLHNRNLGCSGRCWQALYYAFAIAAPFRSINTKFFFPSRSYYEILRSSMPPQRIHT